MAYTKHEVDPFYPTLWLVVATSILFLYAMFFHL